jgi:flagellar hook-associated protein 1
MSLTTAMESARSSLNVLSAKSSVVSRNIANASTPFASRKIANTVTGVGGIGVRLASITRAANETLFNNLLTANSDANRQKAIVDALTQLESTINDTEQETSPAAMIGKLQDAIQQYSASPADPVRAQSAVAAAQDLVSTLNNAADVVNSVREQADNEIANSVANVNSLLSEFESVNNQIIAGTRVNADITDYLDQRDRILNDLSDEMGIKTISRDLNDVAIFTDSGATLFDTTAREVTFEATPFYSAGTVGNVVKVDGVPVTGNGVMPLISGKIKGLAEVRDETALVYQNQLDEIARGIMGTFQEEDPTGVDPTIYSGLFTDGSTETVPDTLARGLAGTIAVNDNVVTDPSLLRDGIHYNYNTQHESGYDGRLLELLDNFDLPRSFDASAQIATNTTITSFSSSSVSWLENERKTGDSAYEYYNTVQERASTSLSKETGVNLDYEMTVLLDLEHSYQATTRLITTIDNMYKYLLQAGA